MSASSPIVEITAVRKSYGALRPLRIQSLSVLPGERVSIAGLDTPAAELMVNLVTGASVPDEGEIRVFGRRTVDVADGEEWLASLDRFGIVSDRAVLLEGATLAQNLALPFTLEIDPVSADTRERLDASCRGVRHRRGVAGTARGGVARRRSGPHASRPRARAWTRAPADGASDRHASRRGTAGVRVRRSARVRGARAHDADVFDGRRIFCRGGAAGAHTRARDRSPEESVAQGVVQSLGFRSGSAAVPEPSRSTYG